MSVTCLRCGQEWPRDPALEVECPVCHAPVSVECRRPSGHRVWAGDIHPERDHLALQVVPGYGLCPAAAQNVHEQLQPSLFAEPVSGFSTIEGMEKRSALLGAALATLLAKENQP